jgi:hypothetical protein
MYILLVSISLLGLDCTSKYSTRLRLWMLLLNAVPVSYSSIITSLELQRVTLLWDVLILLIAVCVMEGLGLRFTTLEN